tara:strand:+ start:12061 stop:12372 length:312 start_codon:yes stop_codon:yes gene_type:complete
MSKVIGKPEIKEVLGKVAKLVANCIAYAWDWPNVERNKYNADDRKRLKRLSNYFSGMAVIVVCSYTVASEMTASTTIAASTVAIFGGHYFAGIVSEMKRSRKD